MKTKQCSRCKKIKPLTDFYVCRRHKDGRTGNCRVCHAASSKASYYAHVDSRRAKGKIYREAHREQSRAYRESHREESRAYHKSYGKARYRRLVRTPRIIAELEAAGYTVTPPARKASRQPEQEKPNAQDAS